jgi:hypothetical protein
MRITKPVGFGVGIVSLWLPVPSVSGICSQAVHSDDTGHLVSPVMYPALGGTHSTLADLVNDLEACRGYTCKRFNGY